MTSFIFIQPHLRFGGAERQTVLVANRLAARGHSVNLILHSASGGLASEVSSQVKLHDLGLESHIATVDIARRMHKALKKLPPSFVIVKLWSSILACALIDKSPALQHHVFNYCEDLDPSDHAAFIRFGKIKQSLIKRIFRSRPHLSANTHTVAESMLTIYGLETKPVVIPSTVDPEIVVEAASRDPRHYGDNPNVVTVGSLIHRKGLDLIRDALERLRQPIDWHVVGEGPLRSELTSYKDPNSLLTIHVHEGSPNPYGFMASADLLIHGARSEAWGIVLLESMAVGTPVLAARSIGPAEMQNQLGHHPEIFRTFDTASVDDLTKQLKESLYLPKVPLPTAHDYISPFTLDRAVDLWELRARRLLENHA